MNFEDYIAKHIFLKIIMNIKIPCILDEEFGIVSKSEHEAEDEVKEKVYYCSLCNETFASDGGEDTLIREHYASHKEKGELK